MGPVGAAAQSTFEKLVSAFLLPPLKYKTSNYGPLIIIFYFTPTPANVPSFATDIIV